MEKNDAIIDFNQEKEKTDEAFESFYQKEHYQNDDEKLDESLEENKREYFPESSKLSEKNSLLEESEYSNIINMASLENKCIIHQIDNETFCINHLIYLCKSCLNEQNKEHKNCEVKDAKNLDIAEIIENIYKDFNDFDYSNEKRIENFNKILETLEQMKKNLSFELLFDSISESNIKKKMMLAKENEKENFVLEIALIIFDKYLTNLIDIHNKMIDFGEKSRKLRKIIKENCEVYFTNSKNLNKNEEHQIFQNFLKNNKALIKLKQDIQIYKFKHLADIIMKKNEEKICAAIFNTIMLHLSKIYSKYK